MPKHVEITEEDILGSTLFVCQTCNGLRVAVPVLFPVNAVDGNDGEPVYTVAPEDMLRVDLAALGVNACYCADCDGLVQLRVMDTPAKKKELH